MPQEYVVRRVRTGDESGAPHALKEPGDGYLGLRLSSIHLAGKHSGSREVAPVFRCVTSVTYAGETRDVASVVAGSVPGESGTDHRIDVLDRLLLPVTPFVGAEVRVHVLLCGVATRDRLAEIFDTVGWAAGLFGREGIGTAVKLAGEVKQRVDRLLDAKLAGVGFGFESSLSVFMGGRGLEPGHLAFIHAPAEDVAENLSVRHGKLVYGEPGGHVEPYTEHDHFVLEVQTRARRGDCDLPGFDHAWRRLRRARHEGREDDVESLGTVLLDLAWESPDLVDTDRDAIVERVDALVRRRPVESLDYRSFTGGPAVLPSVAADPYRMAAVPERLDDALEQARPERVRGKTLSEIRQGWRNG